MISESSGTSPKTMWVDDLPPCFYLVLSPVGMPRGQVALLHGWCMDHAAWLTTAVNLRDHLGLQVLLVDFYNHGRSPTLTRRSDHNAATLTRQLRALIRHIKWETLPLTLGGCSLGGAVALKYTHQWPNNVVNLVLVATAGMPEPWYVPTWSIGWIARLFSGKPTPPSDLETHGSILPASLDEIPTASFYERVQARLTFVSETPTYTVHDGMIEFLQEQRIGITVISGSFDLCHRPHTDLWSRVPEARIINLLGKTHEAVCLGITALKLWEHREYWINDASKL